MNIEELRQTNNFESHYGGTISFHGPRGNWYPLVPGSEEYVLDPTPDMHEEPPADIQKGWQPTIGPDPLAHLKEEGKPK